MAEHKLIQSDLRKGRYVRYQDEDVNLQLSERNSTVDGKLFKHEIELVQHVNGKDTVRIKCLHSKAYWEPKSFNNTQSVVVVAGTNTNDNHDTYFYQERVDEDDHHHHHHHSLRVRFFHIGQQKYAFIKPEFNHYLMLAEQPPSDGSDIFIITDCPN